MQLNRLIFGVTIASALLVVAGILASTLAIANATSDHDWRAWALVAVAAVLKGCGVWGLLLTRETAQALRQWRKARRP